MVQVIAVLLRWFAGFAIAKVFIALAVGLVSFTIVQFFFDKYINAALSQINYMGDAAALMGIAQLDTAISIIMGALSIKAFMAATKVGLGRS